MTGMNIGTWSILLGAALAFGCGSNGGNTVTDTDTGTDVTTDVDGTTDPDEDGDDVPADGVTDTGEDVPTDTPTDGVEDTAEDTDTDFPADVVEDTDLDTPADTSIDTGLDTGTDTGTDTGLDTGLDTGTDTSTDTATDTGTCTYGQTRCNSDDNVETCNTSGTWILTSICPDTCLDGACVYSGSCTPYSRRCRGLVAEQCNSLGTGWIVTEVCADGCLAGLCTGTCVNGETRCNGHVVEECISGTWTTVDDCGTTFCVHAMCADFDLVVDGTTMTLGGEHWYVGNVVVRNFATINVDPAVGWLELHAGGNIEIDATSAIHADDMMCDTRGKGTDVTSSYGGGGGAGHHAAGGSGYYSFPGGPAYGTMYDLSMEYGACGGRGRCNSGSISPGGWGGGAIALFSEGVIQMDGTITANGGNGMSNTSYQCGAGGGGSGGTVMMLGDIVNTSATASIRTDGGSGGDGYSSYDGGAGARGRIRILYGEASGSTIGGTIGGEHIYSVAPPHVLTSPSHPEEGRWYNDGFDDVQITWDRPTNMAVSGYFWRLNTTTVDPPYSGHGDLIDVESLVLDASVLPAGTHHFHITALDADLVTGGVESNFTFQISSTPPTVTSSSHPSTTTFYTDTTVLLFWTDPHDHSNYPNYMYFWDRYADSTPTASLGTSTDDTSLLRTGVPVGIWYLHVISVDTMGYPNRTARHFRVNVGTEPGRGNITGVVRDSITSTFIGGATVVVNGGIWSTTSSTLNGAYSFGSNVYDNTGWPIWEVRASAPGYVTDTHTANVTTGMTTNVDFFLVPE